MTPWLSNIKYISADKFMDLMHLPEYADRAVELVEGVIIDMPLPSPVHAAILANLTHLITAFAKESDVGQVFAGDAPFVLERSPADEILCEAWTSPSSLAKDDADANSQPAL